MPLLGDEGHLELIDCLHHIAKKISKPSAILMVSAHWEESVTTVTSASKPDLIYDYFGFPEESYRVTYPAFGDPKLAGQIFESLERAGIEVAQDAQRGFDHGMFVPSKLMYPEADIPCVQLSSVNSLDPEQHIRIGESLQQLDFENLLIIGSGFSFHNMKAFFAAGNSEAQSNNTAFESWLLETCGSTAIDEPTRRRRLVEWESAPAARYCQPREEHSNDASGLH